jgi:HemY protein
MAARASYRLNEQDKMREYLGQADASEAEAGIAVELTQAELKLDAGQYEQAVATLVRARRNAGRHPYVLNLLYKAYLGLRDWENLLPLLPELKKYKALEEVEFSQLEGTVYINALLDTSRQPQAEAVAALQRIWKDRPSSLKKDKPLTQAYVQQLIALEAHADAEKAMLQSLKQEWDSQLVGVYPYINSGSKNQLAKAEGWLSAHGNDSQLLLCLGRLAAKESLWGKARDYFEKSYKQQSTPEVCAELGRLLASLGEVKSSAAYFREGLLQHETNLPELPTAVPQLEQPVAVLQQS